VSPERSVAGLLVDCLVNEGVEVVFGLPGEENLRVIDALG
jgi:acetolactate synthase-1/2/3 large subunit